MNQHMTHDQTLVITRGLPGSGTTEWAKDWVDEDPTWRIRVSRFDIARQIFNAYPWNLSEQQLSTVSHMQHSMVNGALKAKLSVVVEDPNNLEAQTIREWMSLADRYKVKFENKDFEMPFDTAYKSTIYPQDAFRKFYNFTVKGKLQPMPEKPEVQHLDATAQTYVPDESLPTAYIFDLDGTLFRMIGRSPFAYHRVLEDEVIHNVARVAKILHNNGDEIIFMTGREDSCRDLSIQALKGAGFDTVDHIYMRPTGDKDTPDQDLKLQLFNDHVRNRFNVVGVYDDRRKVCKMWEEIGLTLFRVGPMDADF